MKLLTTRFVDIVGYAGHDFLEGALLQCFQKLFDYLHLHSIQVKADSSKTCIFKTRQLALKRSKWLNGRGRKKCNFLGELSL